MPLHGHRWETGHHSNWYYLTANAFFLVAALKKFFLVFKSWSMKCHGIHFFGIILFGICSASWIYRFVSSTKFWKLKLLFLQIFFEPHRLLFWDCKDTNTGSLSLSGRCLIHLSVGINWLTFSGCGCWVCCFWFLQCQVIFWLYNGRSV